MPGQEKSDTNIVPKNLANKVPDGAAEQGGGKDGDQGEYGATPHAPDAEPGARVPGLRRIRQAGSSASIPAANRLIPPSHVDCLREAYLALKRDAAPGVDGVTWEEYGQDMELRLQDLHRRVHQGTYRAQPVRRRYVAKASGGERPLGISTLEDKIVQRAVVAILNQIYEEAFLGFSYGFRGPRTT